MHHLVVFTLDDLLYALPLEAVTRVIHAIEIRHLSNVPEIITGIINVEGKIIPVIDPRFRFALPVKEMDPDDRLIIARTGKRTIAMLVDTVKDIMNLEETQVELARKSLPFAGYIRGVARVEEGLILIYDLEQFLSLDEEKQLDNALQIKVK
jgi:purine-binding chemotaxis protein CheW